MTTLVPKSPAVKAGVIFVLVMTLIGIFAPLLAPHDPKQPDVLKGVQRIGPFETLENPLGVDILGRDMLSRLIYSFRVPVILGGSAVLLGTVGSIAFVWTVVRSPSFKSSRHLPPGGVLDYSLFRLAGLILLIGPFPMLFGMALLGAGVGTVTLVVTPFASIPLVSLIYWSVRRKSASLSSSTGENAPPLPVRIAGRECMVLLPITYSLAFLMGMLLETPLTFLGLGVPPGAPALGIMISEGRNNLIDIWWLSLLPFGVVALAVVAFLAIVLPIRRIQKSTATLGPTGATGGETMTFCTQCGSQLRLGSSFCSHVGHSLDDR